MGVVLNRVETGNSAAASSTEAYYEPDCEVLALTLTRGQRRHDERAFPGSDAARFAWSCSKGLDRGGVIAAACAKLGLAGISGDELPITG